MTKLEVENLVTLPLKWPGGLKELMNLKNYWPTYFVATTLQIRYRRYLSLSWLLQKSGKQFIIHAISVCPCKSCLRQEDPSKVAHCYKNEHYCFKFLKGSIDSTIMPTDSTLRVPGVHTVKYLHYLGNRWEKRNANKNFILIHFQKNWRILVCFGR